MWTPQNRRRFYIAWPIIGISTMAGAVYHVTKIPEDHLMNTVTRDAMSKPPLSLTNITMESSRRSVFEEEAKTVWQTSKGEAVARIKLPEKKAASPPANSPPTPPKDPQEVMTELLVDFPKTYERYTVNLKTRTASAPIPLSQTDLSMWERGDIQALWAEMPWWSKTAAGITVLGSAGLGTHFLYRRWNYRLFYQLRSKVSNHPVAHELLGQPIKPDRNFKGTISKASANFSVELKGSRQNGVLNVQAVRPQSNNWTVTSASVLVDGRSKAVPLSFEPSKPKPAANPQATTQQQQQHKQHKPQSQNTTTTTTTTKVDPKH